MAYPYHPYYQGGVYGYHPGYSTVNPLVYQPYHQDPYPQSFYRGQSDPYGNQEQGYQGHQALVQTQPGEDTNLLLSTTEWSVGICNCCDDCKQCKFLLYSMSEGDASVAKKINEPLSGCLCVPNIVAVYRMKVRTMFKIKGDSCDDCCVSCFCPPCAGVQLMQELKNRGLP
ncbi:unnamed protein product [Didymodactylos carnosus]|uniref:Uncharacterized protein n=1 Tax=Didymodactylos carnosus TaxID=1234261 RepID=A0A814Q0G8_9BILA|nr:unnamed protein product [Didymodactylos carnosus]CAF1113561.1 unnamed protein product [Didymodactylos carnosus]CAF3552494.1 unnamed protein product [Didymodactylos carnosus]CAF3877658.1 unnamed protein product [Didymodactylos carnosus]